MPKISSKEIKAEISRSSGLPAKDIKRIKKEKLDNGQTSRVFSLASNPPSFMRVTTCANDEFIISLEDCREDGSDLIRTPPPAPPLPLQNNRRPTNGRLPRLHDNNPGAFPAVQRIDDAFSILGARLQGRRRQSNVNPALWVFGIIQAEPEIEHLVPCFYYFAPRTTWAQHQRPTRLTPDQNRNINMFLEDNLKFELSGEFFKDTLDRTQAQVIAFIQSLGFEFINQIPNRPPMINPQEWLFSMEELQEDDMEMEDYEGWDDEVMDYVRTFNFVRQNYYQQNEHLDPNSCEPLVRFMEALGFTENNSNIFLPAEYTQDPEDICAFLEEMGFVRREQL